MDGWMKGTGRLAVRLRSVWGSVKDEVVLVTRKFSFIFFVAGAPEERPRRTYRPRRRLVGQLWRGDWE